MFLSGHKCKTNYYCTKPDNCKAKSYKNVKMGQKKFLSKLLQRKSKLLY